MASQIVDRASERSVDTHQVNSDSSPHSPRGTDLLQGPDPSIHMLGLPKSYPQLGRWLALAVLVGAIAAFLLVTLTGR
jgi:hypothetical protein